MAEYEQAFRHYDKVDEIAQILTNLPLKEHQLIGQYYLGLCKFRKRLNPVGILEDVAEKASPKYRIFAMHSLAAIGRISGNLDTELAWLVESLKIAPSIQSLRGIAILKAIEGNHKAAVKDFEAYLPLIRYVEPLSYYDFLNSYAVELGEVGRKDEARNIIQVVLASPFAHAYPEWQQTAADLQSCSRSVVQVDGSRNVLSMPPTSERVVESPPTQSAKVFNLAEWKEKMVKEPNGKTDESDENLDAMDGKDLLLKLLQLTTKEDVDEDYLREIVKFAVERSTNKNKTDKK